jgi:hypothetical protein
MSVDNEEALIGWLYLVSISTAVLIIIFLTVTKLI